MKHINITNAVCAYFIIAILVFGYSFNAEFPKDRNTTGGELFAASAFGLVWPMYLSVKLFSGVRK